MAREGGAEAPFENEAVRKLLRWKDCKQNEHRFFPSFQKELWRRLVARKIKLRLEYIANSCLLVPSWVLLTTQNEHFYILKKRKKNKFLLLKFGLK